MGLQRAPLCCFLDLPLASLCHVHPASLCCLSSPGHHQLGYQWEQALLWPSVQSGESRCTSGWHHQLWRPGFSWAPRMLLPQEPAAYLDGLGWRVASLSSRSASGTTFSVVLGESLRLLWYCFFFSSCSAPHTDSPVGWVSALRENTQWGWRRVQLVMNSWLWGEGRGGDDL